MKEYVGPVTQRELEEWSINAHYYRELVDTTREEYESGRGSEEEYGKALDKSTAFFKKMRERLG